MALLPFDYGQDEQDYLGLPLDPETGLPRTLLAQAQPQPRPGRALPKSMGMVTNTAPTAPQSPQTPEQPAQQEAPQQPPVQQPAPRSALEQLPGMYDRADLLRNQAFEKLVPSDTDLEQYRRSGTLGQLAGIAMQMLGNESQQAIGGSVLKQSMAELEKGKRDPWKVGEMEAKKLEAQAAALEKRAQYAVTVEEKREALKQANEARREATEMRGTIAQAMIAARQAGRGGGDSENLHLQRAGMTPGGELVSFSPRTGQQMVNGQPYNGPVLSQATMDKQATAVQEALGAMNNLKRIDALVAANPNAFGGVAALSSLTPQIVSSRWQSAKLTPAERETRALVMTQAAQVINDLYGAAVSAGEMGRAQSFVPTNLDDPVSVAVKLKAAQAWANSKANVYGAQVRGAAEARSAPPGSIRNPAGVTNFDPGGDGPPEGAVREKKK